MELGITGPVYSVSTACSSSNHAIGQAFWMVRNGVVESAIAGGSEAVFSMGFLKAWEAMRVVSPDTCRPFSGDRRGLILGEGAAMFVLETLDAAQARGANIYGEIVGFGMSSDAHHITQPSSDGAARAMRSALEDAGIAAESVGYINAHGTGTAANDATETGDPERFRRPCWQARGELDQVDARAHAGRGGSHRGCSYATGFAAWRDSADRELQLKPIRHAIWMWCRMWRVSCNVSTRCRIRSHSEASTQCWRFRHITRRTDE
jgi:3-oxoacyl-(acyl-carrier-protein) synthase